MKYYHYRANFGLVETNHRISAEEAFRLGSCPSEVIVIRNCETLDEAEDRLDQYRRDIFEAFQASRSKAEM